MNVPRARIESDGNGGSHVYVKNLKPDHVKAGIAGTVIVTVTLVIANLIFSIGARSTKYDAACKQIEDHEARLRAVEKAIADIPRIADNTDAIKTMIRDHMQGNK